MGPSTGSMPGLPQPSRQPLTIGRHKGAMTSFVSRLPLLVRRAERERDRNSVISPNVRGVTGVAWTLHKTGQTAWSSVEHWTGRHVPYFPQPREAGSEREGLHVGRA